MSRTLSRRYIPPAETIRENRRAIRRRAISRARTERAETRAAIHQYLSGVVA